MRNRIMLLVAVALVWPALASASSFHHTVELCLGESFVMDAEPGSVLTYTEPKYGFGWPNMWLEASTFGTAEAAKTSVDDGPVWWEVFPNAKLFEGSAAGDQTAAQTLLSPVSYMIAAIQAPSHVAIHARTEGKTNVEAWAFNPYTHQKIRHVYHVTADQCGSTTRITSPSFSDICDGSATSAPGGTSFVSNARNVYAYHGGQSGISMLGGVIPGRAVLTSTGNRANGKQVIAMVSSAGSGICPDNDTAALHPSMEGPNSFDLALCRGEIWMSPSMRQDIESIDISSSFAWAEASNRSDGFIVLGQIDGASEITVNFENAHATPMTIRVHVTTCEFSDE